MCSNVCMITQKSTYLNTETLFLFFFKKKIHLLHINDYNTQKKRFLVEVTCKKASIFCCSSLSPYDTTLRSYRSIQLYFSGEV